MHVAPFIGYGHMPLIPQEDEHSGLGSVMAHSESSMQTIITDMLLFHVGFSFGGMLACCVAANIWKKSFLSPQVLEKNMICITFGQPLMGIAFVQEVIRMFPVFENTIHSVLDKRDLVPRILRYFTVGCTQSCRSPPLQSAQPRPTAVPEANVLVSHSRILTCNRE